MLLDGLLDVAGSAAELASWSAALRNGTLNFGIDRFRRRLPTPLWGPTTTCRPGMVTYGRNAGALDSANASDGQKAACGLERLRAPCTILSIGSHNEWDFEAAVVRRTPCIVHTLDCTLPNTTRPPPALRGRVRFHSACLVPSYAALADAGPSSLHRAFPASEGLHEVREALLRGQHALGGELWEWSMVLRRTGLGENGPAYAKIDIEGLEFTTLYSMVQQAQQSARTARLLPEQLSLELHYMPRSLPFGACADSAPVGVLQREDVVHWLHFLFAHGEYRLLQRRKNLFCKRCDEIVLARNPAGVGGNKLPTTFRAKPILPCKSRRELAVLAAKRRLVHGAKRARAQKG